MAGAGPARYNRGIESITPPSSTTRPAAGCAEGPALPAPPHPTITEAFAASARKHPRSPAVITAGRSFTYGELDCRAEELERRLRAAGVRRGERAAIVLDRSIDMVAAVLAVLRCGAAYVPVDPAYPEARVKFMLRDCGAAAVATSAARRESLRDVPAPLVLVDGPDSKEPAAKAGGPEAADLAYILYTSGSTGAPKGVAVEHRNVVNLLESMRREPGFGAADVWLAVTTLSFDIAGLELFMPLTTGGRIVLASREEALDGKALARMIDSHGVTCLQATPATWRLLLESGWKGRPGLKALCGGEAVPRPLAQEILGRGARLWNVYGPTETTIWSTLDEVSSGEGILPVGRPVGNTVIRILDEKLRPLPAGESGEVAIGGAGVARGYWNRPELTAQRFIADPAAGGGARLYRTGDRGQLLPDGRLRLFGRNDDQVKIRGLRVELGEVEAALAAHPSVAAAAATVRDDGKGPRLAAYWVPRAGAEVEAREFREFLGKTLPPHMIPSVFTALDALPLTPNGKIDRRALPAPFLAPPATRQGATRGGAAETAGTPLQELLRGLWKELLGLAFVGLDDDFFELGGHSLLAIQMLSRVERSVGRRPSLSAFAEKPTIEHLTEALGRQAPADGTTLRFGPAEGDPFFLLHGDNAGGGFYCRGVAQAMPRRPFFALAPDDLNLRAPVPTIEEMASRHLEAIRAVRPHGPYRLGGYCIAGMIAYEMAQQLEAAGERVDGLVFLTYPHHLAWWRCVRRVAAAAGRLRGWEQAAVIEHFMRWGKFGLGVSRIPKRGWKALRARLCRAGSPEGAGRAKTGEMAESYMAFQWAWAGYRPGTYRGPVTIIEAKDDFEDGEDSASELRRLAPAVELAYVRGDHLSILTSHVAELGAEIDRRLTPG